jgi:Flp pilus assembly protein TadG
MTAAPLEADETGAVFVEVAVLFPIILTVLFGSVDLLYAFYQWNAAAKAVEVGARIAAVSDPVASGLNGLSNQAVLNGVASRSAMPAFVVTCNGAATTCACVGACVGMTVNSYDAAAMNRIVFGRGSATCGDTTSYYTTGMCDVLPEITAANVMIVYRQTGLGYAGRPGGPVPTISVSLQNMKFQFFFLSAILVSAIPIPAMTTTITAEDLCSAGGDGSCGS